MTTIDNILELLDNSLQTPISPQQQYTCDHTNTVKQGVCWRCANAESSPTSLSGLCEPCRSWMACESDVEPPTDSDLGRMFWRHVNQVLSDVAPAPVYHSGEYPEPLPYTEDENGWRTPVAQRWHFRDWVPSQQ